MEKSRSFCSVIKEIAKNSCYIFFHKTLLKMFLPSLRNFWELSSQAWETFCSSGPEFKSRWQPTQPVILPRSANGKYCCGLYEKYTGVCGVLRDPLGTWADPLSIACLASHCGERAVIPKERNFRPRTV